MKPRFALLLSLLLSPSLALHAADLKLAGVFTDHAVLQRDAAAPVWGRADPGEKLTVGDVKKVGT